jgi:hypothetical protein
MYAGGARAKVEARAAPEQAEKPNRVLDSLCEVLGEGA